MFLLHSERSLEDALISDYDTFFIYTEKMTVDMIEDPTSGEKTFQETHSGILGSVWSECEEVEVFSATVHINELPIISET